MDFATRTIVIDGTEYRLQFQGFGHHLVAAAPDGRTVRLEAWTLRAHLDALRACLVPNAQGLTLDRAAFVEAVFTRCGVPLGLVAPFGSLALWWAAGGEPVADAAGGTEIDLGSHRARLRAWTHGERMQALDAALSDRAGVALDVVSYLEAMLRACVVQLDPATDLFDLDSAAAARVISAVTVLNSPAPAEAAPVLRGLGDSEQTARATLRLCRALGWTPSQVWTAPAAEVDRMLVLLDRIEGRTHPAQHTRPRRIADMPDAVVIRIEDE